jgi:hypothetical protein
MNSLNQVKSPFFGVGELFYVVQNNSLGVLLAFLVNTLFFLR